LQRLAKHVGGPFITIEAGGKIFGDIAKPKNPPPKIVERCKSSQQLPTGGGPNSREAASQKKLTGCANGEIWEQAQLVWGVGPRIGKKWERMGLDGWTDVWGGGGNRQLRISPKKGSGTFAPKLEKGKCP